MNFKILGTIAVLLVMFGLYGLFVQAMKGVAPARPPPQDRRHFERRGPYTAKVGPIPDRRHHDNAELFR